MRISTLLTAPFTALTLAMALQVAHAGAITVTTTQDEQTANGQCSLREAVQAANTDLPVDTCPAGSGADTIVVPAGVYTLTITGTNVISLTPTLLVLTSQVAIIGNNSDDTIIKSTGFCNYFLNPNCPDRNRLIYIAPEAIATLKNVTLSENSWSPGGVASFGGGIFNDGNLSLDSTQIENSIAENGGGIYNIGTMIIRTSDIMLNSVFNLSQYVTGMGGGIDNWGSLRIESSTIRGNSRGGIVNAYGATLLVDSAHIENNTGSGLVNFGEAIVRNTVVFSNSSAGGAGIYSTGNLAISNSSITKNTATGGGNKGGNYPGDCGGLSAGGYLTMTNSVISFNRALSTTDRYSQAYLPGTAGGACLFGKAAIANSAIYSNIADNAGGIQVRQYTSEPESTFVRLQNVTISSNTAYSRSSGIEVIGGTIDVQYSTIASNTSPSGSNVFVTSTTWTNWNYGWTTVFILGKIFFHNTLIAGSNTNCINEGGVIESAGFNLSSDSSCTTLTTTGDITNTDPLIGPLQTNWPGAMPTHALLPGSPAINKGEYVRSDSTLTDQRGIYRRWGGAYADIGAYEVFDPSILRPVYLPIMQR